MPIDLALNAFQNSKKLFDAKKAAGKKKEKTIQSSIKALKSAEAKAKATLETVSYDHSPLPSPLIVSCLLRTQIVQYF